MFYSHCARLDGLKSVMVVQRFCQVLQFLNFISEILVNECEVNNGGCIRGACIDLPVGYNCSCTKGFALLQDGLTCNGMQTLYM